MTFHSTGWLAEIPANNPRFVGNCSTGLCSFQVARNVWVGAHGKQVATCDRWVGWLDEMTWIYPQTMGSPEPKVCLGADEPASRGGVDLRNDLFGVSFVLGGKILVTNDSIVAWQMQYLFLFPCFYIFTTLTGEVVCPPYIFWPIHRRNTFHVVVKLR